MHCKSLWKKCFMLSVASEYRYQTAEGHHRVFLIIRCINCDGILPPHFNYPWHFGSFPMAFSPGLEVNFWPWCRHPNIDPVCCWGQMIFAVLVICSGICGVWWIFSCCQSIIGLFLSHLSGCPPLFQSLSPSNRQIPSTLMNCDTYLIASDNASNVR